MSEQIFIDSNIFIRFFTKDDPQKAELVKDFFLKSLEKDQELVVNFWAFAEIEFVLRRQYSLKKQEILSLLRSIFTIENINIFERELIGKTLLIFEKNKIDFVDALTVGFLKIKEIDKIASYDTHFDKLEKVKRISP